LSLDLSLRLQRVVPFDSVLARTREVLRELLRVDAVPLLLAELTPRDKAARHKPSLENRLVDVAFPGAYIGFEGDDPIVSFLVIDGTYSMRVALSSGRTPEAEVLTAAAAIALSQLMNGTEIGDYGHHWIDQDESVPEEFMGRLALTESPSDFAEAIQLVYRKLAIHERYPLPKS
jgi:hypothetical protein